MYIFVCVFVCVCLFVCAWGDSAFKHCKLLVPPCVDFGQHFTVDCDLMSNIKNANINAI